jgi:hypothetical protein
MISLHNISDAVTGAIAGSSVVLKILPPPEKFSSYPRFQKFYTLIYIFVSFIALNK